MSFHLFSPSVLILFMTALVTLDSPAQTEAIQKPSRPHVGLRVALAQIPVEDGHLDRNMHLAEEAAAQAVGGANILNSDNGNERDVVHLSNADLAYGHPAA